MATAHLFIDYQNVHFTAWECFSAYGTPVWQSLVHPVKFAEQIRAARSAKGYDDIEFTKIHVFRGMPSRRNEPNQHARVQRQASNWTRDRRVMMNLRSLRYPRAWPDDAAQEKGVDVALAIGIVRASLEGHADVLVVATRDTDIVPALDLVQADGTSSLELATWAGQSQLVLSPKPNSVTLDKGAFQRSRDTADYR